MRALTPEEAIRLQKLELDLDVAQRQLDDFKLKVGLICPHPAEKIEVKFGVKKCLKCDTVIG